MILLNRAILFEKAEQV